MKRRDFTLTMCRSAAALTAGMAGLSGLKNQNAATAKANPKKGQRLAFLTRTRRIGIINCDGSGLEYLHFDIPGQESWGSGPIFEDGERMLVTSYEKGKVWEGEVRTHIWIYNFSTKELTEIATKNRPSNQLLPAILLPGGKRMITQPTIDGEQRLLSMNLDGSDQVEITKAGDGYTYGASLSPDGTRLAFHVTNTMPYSIFSAKLDGSERKKLASDPDHLFFGTSWSPDGEWVLYQDCLFREDPGHDWSDLWIARPDGSETRRITDGLRHWFGTSYGDPETKGGGSNMPEWSPDGRFITHTRAKTGSLTAWQWANGRPDTDHFNRDYYPEKARGGTDICLVDPETKEFRKITDNEPLAWDFRTVWSPDGKTIAFARARIGEPSGLWLMDADGGNQRFLTLGEKGLGADHHRFF